MSTTRRPAGRPLVFTLVQRQRKGEENMTKYRKTQDVQVCRNIGSMGPCWLPAEYIQAVGDRHRVMVTSGDFIEIVSVSADCIRSG